MLRNFKIDIQNTITNKHVKYCACGIGSFLISFIHFLLVYFFFIFVMQTLFISVYLNIFVYVCKEYHVYFECAWSSILCFYSFHCLKNHLSLPPFKQLHRSPISITYDWSISYPSWDTKCIKHTKYTIQVGYKKKYVYIIEIRLNFVFAINAHVSCYTSCSWCYLKRCEWM